MCLNLNDGRSESLQAGPDPPVRVLTDRGHEVIRDVRREVHAEPDAHDQAEKKGMDQRVFQAAIKYRWL